MFRVYRLGLGFIEFGVSVSGFGLDGSPQPDSR